MIGIFVIIGSGYRIGVQLTSEEIKYEYIYVYSIVMLGMIYLVRKMYNNKI